MYIAVINLINLYIFIKSSNEKVKIIYINIINIIEVLYEKRVERALYRSFKF